MAKTFTIPSIYTAIDKVSPVLSKMGRNVSSFASKAEAGILRADRAFRRMTPGIGAAGKQLLSFAGTAAIVGGIMAGISFSANGIIQYDKSLASFRTIVSDLNDKEFDKFKTKIGEVANATKESSTTVAQSFEKIAGLNAKFAETAEGLGLISQAAIVLSQASGDDLATAADNLVGIMNQFSFQAKDANRVINALAAGQAVGAATITETSDAFKVFGAVAKQSNISLEQSVALVEVLASKQIKGAEAGTALRGTLVRLKASGLGYTSGVFNMNDALTELKTKYDKLATAKQKDALLDKVFGTINLTTGSILLENIGLYNEFTKSVTGTTEAQKAANINNATIAKSLERLGNVWINLITTNKHSSTAMKAFNWILVKVVDNLETIVGVVGTAVLLFVAWKAIVLTTAVVMGGYNLAIGVMGALTGIANISIGKSSIAMKAYSATLVVAEGIQWLMNAAVAANPYVLIAAAIIILIGYIIYLCYHTEQLTSAWEAGKIVMMGFGEAIQTYVNDKISASIDLISSLGSALGELLSGNVGKAQDIAVKAADKYNKSSNMSDLVMQKAMWSTAAQAADVYNAGQAEGGAGGALKELVNPQESIQRNLTETIKTSQQNISIDINDPTQRARVSSDNSIAKVNLSSTMKQ